MPLLITLHSNRTVHTYKHKPVSLEITPSSAPSLLFFTIKKGLLGPFFSSSSKLQMLIQIVDQLDSLHIWLRTLRYKHLSLPMHHHMLSMDEHLQKTRKLRRIRRQFKYHNTLMSRYGPEDWYNIQESKRK